MARTAQLDLPLLMPSQAQKHVTVNEALARIDAAAQLRVVSVDRRDAAGERGGRRGYLVPSAATGAWAGQGGRIAVWSNGGWTFLLPRAGWRAWNESSSGHLMFDGTGWIEDAIAVAPGGAAVAWTVREFDHPVTAGAANLTAETIPGQAQVLGVTGRVIARADRWARQLAHRRQRVRQPIRLGARDRAQLLSDRHERQPRHLLCADAIAAVRGGRELRHRERSDWRCTTFGSNRRARSEPAHLNLRALRP